MKVFGLRKVISHGSHQVRQGEVKDVPESIAKGWIDAGYARPATAGDETAPAPTAAAPAKATTRAK